MSHFLTEDQKMIVNSVREFCQSPSTLKMIQEDKASGVFAMNSWKAAAEQGYIASYLPEEYGGMGYDLTTHYAIFEELCRNSYPCCAGIAGHILGILSIEHWGTDEQKALFLPQVGSGEKLCAGAATDPAGGTNFSEWGFKEEELEDGWRLNGTKVITTNAAHADYKVVFGRPENGRKWYDHFYLIHKDTPGLEVGEQEKKLVPDGGDWGTIIMKDVVVPKINRFDRGDKDMLWMGPSYMMVAVEALVFGEHAFNLGFGYATQRSRGGGKLIDLQKVAHYIADIATRNEASRGLIYTAARLWDEGRQEECYRLACMAKVFAAEGANKSLHDSALIHGGIGCTVPGKVGVLYAASLQLEVAEYTSDIHRDFIIESYGVDLDWKTR